MTTRLFVIQRRKAVLDLVARHPLGATEETLVAELAKVFRRRPMYCRWLLRDLLVNGLIELDPDIWRMRKRRFYRAAAKEVNR